MLPIRGGRNPSSGARYDEWRWSSAPEGVPFSGFYEPAGILDLRLMTKRQPASSILDTLVTRRPVPHVSRVWRRFSTAAPVTWWDGNRDLDYAQLVRGTVAAADRAHARRARSTRRAFGIPSSRPREARPGRSNVAISAGRRSTATKA